MNMNVIDLLMRKILCCLLLIGSFHCFSQTGKIEKDSALVASIANDFFVWYISAAKSGMHAEYNPVEVEDANGMTTLDFSKYIQNLKAHSFSDSLIAREKRSYDGCVQKLAKVQYTDYLKLQDLDEFEALEDDFTNYYRWTGGQEMFDFYKVIKVDYDNKNIIVIGCLYDDPNTCLREITMTLCRQKNAWKIVEIRY